MEQDSLSGYQFGLSESLDKCSPVCPLCVPEVSGSHQTQHVDVSGLNMKRLMLREATLQDLC